MKKLIILFLFACSGLAFSAEGFQITYSVKVDSGKGYQYEEMTTVCGDFLRIDLSAGQYVLFDKKKGRAWKVNSRTKTATEYSFEDNQPFYQQFLMAYGLMDNGGQLIFPQVIFKRTGNRKVVKGAACFEARLPGEFMNSATTVWMPDKALNGEGEKFSQYMSFFTKNGDFLDLIRHTNGFPRKIISRIQLSSGVAVNTKMLEKITSIDCKKPDLFKLPKGVKIRKAAPSGIPLRSF